MRLLNVFDFAWLHRIGETATHPIATLARPLAALQLLARASYYSALCLASEHARDTLGRVQLRIPG